MNNETRILDINFLTVTAHEARSLMAFLPEELETIKVSKEGETLIFEPVTLNYGGIYERTPETRKYVRPLQVAEFEDGVHSWGETELWPYGESSVFVDITMVEVFSLNSQKTTTIVKKHEIEGLKPMRERFLNKEKPYIVRQVFLGGNVHYHTAYYQR